MNSMPIISRLGRFGLRLFVDTGLVVDYGPAQGKCKEMYCICEKTLAVGGRSLSYGDGDGGRHGSLQRRLF